MNKAKRGGWLQLERARIARDRLQWMAGLRTAEGAERRYRTWQRVLSAFVAATLFVGPITITVETGRDAAGVLAAGSRRLDDAAWQAIRDLASLRIRFAMNAAEAAPIVDPTAPITFRPQITQSTGSGGGVPVVNIAAPNQAGISLNQYQSFNIDAIGLILNNSLQGGTTLTGGNVSANPNLNGRTASVIVNQVTSSGPGFASVLAGPLEVFGAPATVVIANPNGIAVRGAGFTNTIGVTLTTGTPQFLTGVGGAPTDFTNGQALAYDVSGGHIQIEGNAGVNGPGAGIEGTVGTIDLIGETIGINAPLYAGTRINVIAGDQRVTPTVVDAASGSTTYGASANGSANTAAAIGNVNQGYAIDATAYGAMTAGQISMVATAAGMGVRSDAALSATAGNLTLSSNGDLTTTGAGLSVGNYEVNAAGDVVSTGTVKSNADLSMTAGRNVAIAAQTTAVNDIALSAGQDVALTGSLASGKALTANVAGAFGVPGSLLVGTDATVASGSFDVPGVVIVQQNGFLTTQRDITASGSIAFGQSGALTSGHDVNLTGKLLANGLQVNVANSATFADVQAGGAFQVVANGLAGNGNVTFNGNAASVGNANIQSAGDVIVNGTLAGGAHANVVAQGNISVTTPGTLQSVGDLSLTAATGSVNSTGSISSGGALAAQAAQNVTLTGTTNAGGNASLNAGGDVTVDGTFASQGNGAITAGHDITFAGNSGFSKDITANAGNNLSVTGALQGDNVTLTANDAIALNNVQANAALAITTKGTAGSGDIAVNGTVASLSTGTVNAAGAVAVNGTLKTAGALGMTAATDTIIAGTLTSNGDMTLANTRGSLTSAGTIQSGGNLTANAAQSIDLGTGATSSLGDLSVTAGQNVTMNGTIVSQGNGTIWAGGAISGAASLAFGLNANLTSLSDTTLTGSLRGATIRTNAGGSGTFTDVQAGSDIAMSANNDLNVTGTLVGGANVNLAAGHDINVSGTTTVTLDTALQSGRDINVTGTLNGQGNGYLTAGRDIVGNGSLGFQQAAVLDATGSIAQSGLLQGQSVQASSGGDMSLNNVQSATAVTLNAGTSSFGNLTVNGSVSAAQGIMATALGNLTVGGNGKLAAGSTIGVGALNDINVAGVIESVGDTTLNAQFGSLNATGGVNSGGKLSITTGLDLSLGASTTSVGDMTLTAGRNAVLNGTLVGQGNGFVTAGQDITGPGTQAFATAAIFNAQRDIALTGSLQADSIQATGADNASLNNVTSNATLSLTANGNAGNGDASITGTATAPGAVTLSAARDAIVSGSLGGGSTVTVTASRNVTVTGGLQSVSDLSVTATNGTASFTGTATTSGALNVTSGLDAILGGQTNATGAVNVQAGNGIQLTGSLAGQSTGTLTAGQDISGAGAAAFAQAAALTAGNNLALTGSLQGASVAVLGLNNAGLGAVQATSGDFSVTALGLAGQGDVTFGGAATSMGTVSLEAARDIDAVGAINAIGTATINAARNVTTSDVTAGGALSMTATSGSVGAGNLKTNANLGGTAGNSVSTGSINAGGTATLNAQGLDGTGDINVGGALASGAATSITAARDATLSSTGTTGGALTVSAGRDLTANGNISTNADTTLTATSGNLRVTGAVTTVGNLNASAGGSLALAGGLINGNTALDSGTTMTLINDLYGLGTATIMAGGAIGGGGSLTIGGDIALTSGAGVTLGGIQGAGQLTATSVGDMSLGATTAVGNVTAKSTAGSVTFNGELQSGGAVRINAANNVAVTGGVSSVGNVSVIGTNGNVSVAGVSTNGDTTLIAGKTLTLNGTSVVAGELSLTGGNVTLAGSQSGSKSITVTAQGSLDASQSSIVSSQNLQMSGTNVTLGNAIVGGTLNAQASNQLSLVGSAVDVVGSATLTSQSGLYNASNVLAGGALNVSAPSITNAANASLASTSTTTISATNFTNAGLVNGKTTSVTVGGTLNNSGGSLMGVNALTINTGVLNNQNGLIFAGDPNSPTGATGDLSITINGGGSAFANAGGELLAQRNLTLGAVNAALDPSQGTISQGGQLSITAGSINVAGTWNYGGQGVSIDGINGITNTGTMTGTAPLTISTNGTFANYGTVTGQDVTFNGYLYNVANAVVHAGDVLAINGNVTNRGTVEAANTLNVVGGSYDNQGALTQTQGNANFDLGGTLQNTGGSILAGNNVVINAAAVVNDQTAPTGTTSSTTVVNSPNVLWSSVIGSESWGFAYEIGTTDSGAIGDVGYASATATLGNLLAPSAIWGTPQNLYASFYGFSGYCIADGCGDVGRSSSDPVSGFGTVTFDQVSIQTGSNNRNGDPIYGYAWIPATGPISGETKSVTLSLPTVYETTTTQEPGVAGVISAGGSISLTSNSLSNRGGQIGAGRNVTLNTQSLSNGAVAPTVATQTTDWVDAGQLSAFLNAVQSLGANVVVGTSNLSATYGCDNNACHDTVVNFQFGSVTAGSATSSLTWSTPTGLIAAGNTLTVQGGNLVNAGQLYAGNNVVIGAASLTNQGGNQQNNSTQVGCASGVPSSACGNGGTPRGGNPTTTTFSYSQNDATIYAGNDLVIAAGQVNNTYGNLLAGHDIVIGGVGTTATSTTPAQSLNNTSGNIVAGNNITLNVSGAITNNLPPPVPVHENYGSKEQYAGCMTAGGYKESYCEGYVDQQSGSSSVISAGNNLQINAGSLTNIGSLIAAGNSATINVAGPVINEAQTLNAYWHSHWVQETGMFSSDKRHDIWACGSAAECTALYGSAYTSVGGVIDPPTPVGNIAATIQAPNLSITSDGQIQNVGNVLGTYVSLTGQRLVNGITTANTYTPRVNSPSQVISLSSLMMPGFNVSTPRPLGATPTLEAGKASYVDGSLGAATQNLYSPQLLLSNLPANLQPSTTLFYYNPQEEDLLLQQAALQQTGKASFVDGLSYDSQNNLSVTEQEKRYLYANALSYAEANDVPLGQALTQTQINVLDKPMLWYVEQTIPDPSCKATGTATCPTITALMPQVYLPSTTSALSAGGNIIGTDVTLNFEGNGQGSILNTGTITASDTLKVDTPTLTNEANQVDVGQIWSKVKGGYVDTTGTEVQPGGYMSAANMDLNVQTLNQIGGALQKLNADGTVDEAGTQQMLAALQQQLGGSFTQMSVSDNLHTSFTAAGGFGVAQLMAIVVAVAAAIAMQPEISAEIGTLAGATAGSGTLMAAAAGTVGAGIGNVALSAAITGLASSSLSQLISTGNIDFGSVFETAGVAALTAGLLNGITYSPSAGLGFSTTASNNSLAALAGIQPSIGGGLVPTASSTIAQLPTQALAIAGEATVQAAVQSTIEGGSFLKALEDSAINDAAAAAAFDIGEAKTTLTTDFGIGGGDALYIVLHGALGCAASAAEGTGCAGGAIGGAAGAFLNTTVDANGNIPAPLDVAMTTMVGGLIAGALGANAQGAATAAENETLNNWLNHVRPGPMQLSEQERSDAALAACNAGDAASCNTYKSLQAASQQRDADLANACSGGFGSAGCRAQVAAALAGGNEVQSVNGAMYAFDPSAPAIKAVGDPYQSTYANSFDGQLAQSTLDGIQMAPIPLTGVGVFGKIGSWLGFGTADAGRLSGPMATVLDGAGGAINNGLAGSVANANFAQSSINAAGTFSVEGAAKYTQLAGVPISTVDDLAAAIKNGLIKPSQLPVDYVVTADGAQLILNTRTSVALSRAGVPQSRWYGVNQTGIQVPGMPAGITFNDLAAGQLARNKLPPTGTPNLP